MLEPGISKAGQHVASPATKEFAFRREREKLPLTVMADRRAQSWWGKLHSRVAQADILPCRRPTAATALLLALTVSLAQGQNAPDLRPLPGLGLRMPEGFQVSLYADARLADDISAMAIDPQGRVVVAGPGYIKILSDPEGRGQADRFLLFATPKGTGTGLCFRDTHLYFTGDDALYRFDYGDGTRPAQRPPVSLFPVGTGEGGGHAVHQGPDGSLYLVGGPESGIKGRLITAVNSPVREVDGGVLVRFPVEGHSLQVLAHGLHSPYDFAFDLAGEIFAWDGGAEAEGFLPWHLPPRVVQVTTGTHAGWQFDGTGRACGHPDHSADSGGTLLPVGRGLPRGIVCYRHRQFPADYRGGLFALDWAAGRIYFVGLQPEGSGYRARADVFLEPVPPAGFMPTALAVSTNGSLYVACGGRKTRGAVFRIDYVGLPLLDPVVMPTPFPELNHVLQAPQPLDAWSRAVWIPEARRVGMASFVRTIGMETVDPVWRARAIEIMTEVFGGLPQTTADAGASAASPLVRARTAWSLGRAPCPNLSLVLFSLLDDPHPLPRRCALEAAAQHIEALESPDFVDLVASSLAFPDKQVRQAAAHAASRLSRDSWTRLVASLPKKPSGAHLTAILAQIWRQPGGGHPELLDGLTRILAESKEPVLRRDALRLIILALGDWNVQKPTRGLYAGYEAAALPANQGLVLSRIRVVARSLLPSGNSEVDAEAARLLAMLQDPDPRIPRVLLGFITFNSPVQSDIHWLVCLSRLPAWPPEITPFVANALLSVNRKLAEPAIPPRPIRSPALVELQQILLQREPKLAPLLVNHALFPTPPNLAAGLAAQLPPDFQPTVANLFLAAASRTPLYPWSPPLLDLFSVLPPAEIRPLLRSQWNNLPLREDLLLSLAAKPDAVDTARLLTGLTATRLDVVGACLTALHSLPLDLPRTNLAPSFGLLRRLVDEPKEKALRAAALQFIEAETGVRFGCNEPDPPPRASLSHSAALKAAYRPVFLWLATNQPPVAASLGPDAGDDPVRWLAIATNLPWANGDAGRGERLAIERGCAACHGGPSAVAPNLAGITTRLNTDELVDAILFPSHEVAEAYRPTLFLRRNGPPIAGLVAWESDDFVILHVAPPGTIRLHAAEIVSRQPAPHSFMPAGLLGGLPPEALADLVSFLKSLQP
jgi:putative heme-binding domain-containing protein